MLHHTLSHPLLALVSACMGVGTLAQIVREVTPGPDPNLAALATICGALATIFSGWVALRNRRRKPSPKRAGKPTKKSPDNGAK